jgi:hydroxyacylglutathione hydrolase
MYFRTIYDDKLAQAAYLIGCQRTGESIVVDPQRDVDRYIKAAEAERLRIVGVAETHIHADYLSGVRELAEQTGATVYVSDEGDADWKYHWVNPYPHRLLKDKDVFRAGNIEFRVIHTPGHTPEHICFLVTDRGSGADEPMGILTGDFVFVGDLGRPDLLETAAGQIGAKEVSAHALFRSAQQFCRLPDYLQVWPAHGAGSACGKALGAVPQSTVGYEKRFNPALLAADDEFRFVQQILEGQPEPPLYFARMKQWNKNGPPILGSLPQPRELTASDLAKLDGRTQAVLDTRPWPQFRAGHIPGALHVPLNNQFPTIAGSYVDATEEIVLVAEPWQVQDAVRALVRVGLDKVRAFAAPARLMEAAQHGLKLVASKEIDARTFIAESRKPGAFVLDVRRAGEYESGHVAGSLNIAHTRLAAHLDQLPKNRDLLVHCQGGVRSAYATALLERNGFQPINIAGGFGAYEKAGGEVARETASVR